MSQYQTGLWGSIVWQVSWIVHACVVADKQHQRGSNAITIPEAILYNSNQSDSRLVTPTQCGLCVGEQPRSKRIPKTQAVEIGEDRTCKTWRVRDRGSSPTAATEVKIGAWSEEGEVGAEAAISIARPARIPSCVGHLMLRVGSNNTVVCDIIVVWTVIKLLILNTSYTFIVECRMACLNILPLVPRG